MCSFYNSSQNTIPAVTVIFLSGNLQYDTFIFDQFGAYIPRGELKMCDVRASKVCPGEGQYLIGK